MRVKLIINPVAGGGKIHQYMTSIKKILRECNELDISFTQKPGEAVTLSREAIRQEYECIVASGGDGTLNEVINGVIREDPAIPIGFIPLGITSVFALSAGIPRHPLEAARIINQGHPRRMDLGKISGNPPTYFASMLGLGFDALVVKKVLPGEKQRWGRWAFIVQGVREWMLSPLPSPFLLQEEKGETYSCFQAVISNAPYYGGPFFITPSANLNDGRLDICIFQKRGKLSLLHFISRVIQGKHLSLDGVKYLRTRSAKIWSEKKIGAQIDGDFWGYLPIEVEASPLALNFILP